MTTDSTVPALTAASAFVPSDEYYVAQGGGTLDRMGTAQQMADFVSPSTIAVILRGVNFNFGSAHDNPISIVLPTGITRYMVSAVLISNASASISTATAGLFTAGSGGGVAIVTNSSAITVTASAVNTNNNSMSFTVNNAATEAYNASQLFFRTVTSQGSTATADVIIHIRPLS